MRRETVIYFESKTKDGNLVNVYVNHEGYYDFIEGARRFKTDKDAIGYLKSLSNDDITFYQLKHIYTNG